MFRACYQALCIVVVLLSGSLMVDRASGALPPLEWKQRAGGRFRTLALRPGAAAGFDSMSARATGIQFSNHLTQASAQRNRLLEDGSGVAAGDVDGDGWCDLYFCRLDGANQLYRNLGDWKFENVTEAAGAACADQYSTGAVFADLDGDGDLDLLVNATGRGTRCFLNDGRGHFTESLRAGFEGQSGARSFALADVDGDGDLDVYVTHYRATTAKDAPVHVRVRQSEGRWVVPPEHRDRFAAEVNAAGKVGLLELGEPDVLYLNDGHAVFAPVSWTGGKFLDEQGRPLAESPKDWGLSAMFRDLNQDGRPDLYVCNDFYTPDRVWINQGDGVFRAMDVASLRKTSWASMAVDFADINRDGFDDFFVAEMLSRHLEQRQTHRSLSELDPMPAWGWGWRRGEILSRTQVMRNTLLLNRGDQSFAEIGQFSGVAASEWTWGASFLDVDLDGFEDLLIANGHALDLANSDSVAELNKVNDPNDPRRRTLIHSLFARLDVPKVAFRNRGDLTFEEAGAAWGFDYSGAANGMAFADLDNDGDLDVILNNFDAPATLLKNRGSAPRLAVRLKGLAGNPQGIGARIVVTGARVPQSQEMMAGGRYLSADDAVRTFAGSASNALTVEVRWRSGARSQLLSVPGHGVLEVDEASAASAKQSEDMGKAVVPATLFEDVSARLRHVDVDKVDDDGSIQPLLPRRLSQPGPGVSWMDLNGDHHADLAIPAGRGGSLSLYFGDGKGGFQPFRGAPWGVPSPVGQTMALAWSPEPQSQYLILGQGSYCGQSVTNGIAHYNIWAGGIDPLPGIAGIESTLGPMAAADFDGDGDADLFVGGRAIPGRYPHAAPSALYVSNGGRFTKDSQASAAWAEMGLVNSALWSDLNNDGRPELIVACEWGPIRVWALREGRWSELTEGLGLSQYRGFWSGVTTADVDGDGRLDIVATNWGRNNKYNEFLAGEIRIFHGDLDGNETWDVIEAVLDPVRKAVVPFRDRRTLLRALPFLEGSFGSYQAFAKASVADLLGDKAGAMRELRVNTLDSMVFLNRGARMQAMSLPTEAQFATAFGVTVADFDGDGKEDLFLSQNCFTMDAETSRDDAGRGLVLKGDGTGRFAAMAGAESGVRIYGEQRGCAVADFDEDGRPDLVVTQNSGSTQLYRNRRGSVGLRVRVEGPMGNGTGIGTKLRLIDASGTPSGPVREIHAGSGYWSQDDAVQVLRGLENPKQLWVQWPTGVEEKFALPLGVREIVIGPGVKPRIR